jgi:hypothetical protein
MTTETLGQRLKRRRIAQGRTHRQVAADAEIGFP